MKKYSGAFALLALAACVPHMTPQQTAFLHELADRPVTCAAKADCDEKWSRAVQWVTRHSGTGIKTLSENLIQTNNVTDGNRPPDRYPEFTVVRYMRGHGYVMDFTSYCEHGFTCNNPSGLQIKADFVTAMIGLPSGVVEIRPGVFQKKIPH